MSRSTSQTSTITGNTANGLSRSLSVKTNPKSSPNANPLAPSDIKLFVINLRLLDLDRKPDWPNISAQTFSSKNADQKQRIGAVEWSLYRLFELCDPEETSQKLQPFFPPLEPLQSLNLRAALYRCLNELKKNGMLGREAVLRKTMLDECKGEKFYEILALFSTAVLKKIIAVQRPVNVRAVAIASTLSTAATLNKDNQRSLLPLAIAHKIALASVLQRKNEKRRRFKDFEALLDSKAGDIDRRIMRSRATLRTLKNTIPSNDVAKIKKYLEDNWIGNQQWLDTMLHGNNVQVEDAFLQQRFDEVWPMVEHGRNLEDAAPEVGLLENLQLRVQQQQSRLHKWKHFHKNFRQEIAGANALSSKPATPAKEINFEDHLKLQLGVSGDSGKESVQRDPIDTELRKILTDMDAELQRASKSKHNRSVAPQLRRRTSSMSGSQSPVRRKKSQSESISKPSREATGRMSRHSPPSRKKSGEIIPLRTQRPNPTPTPLDSEATLVGHPSTTLRTTLPPQQSAAAPVPETQEDMEDHSDPLPTVSSPTRPLAEPQNLRSPSPEASSCWPSEPPLLEHPLNAEDALAEQIVSSIGAATPSPIKQQPRPSLVERTRMSMARTTSFPPLEESPALTSPPLTDLQPTRPNLDRPASLIDRTRLSMAAMSQNPRPKKDNRMSSGRQSLFPINQFDTPRNRKSIQVIEEAKSGEVTPKEDLFSDDIDYDRVFKSRPRVAHSPIISPELGTRRAEDAWATAKVEHGDVSALGIDVYDEEYDEGVTGVDLGDVDAGDEDGFTQAWENSPSRKAGSDVRGATFSNRL